LGVKRAIIGGLEGYRWFQQEQERAKLREWVDIPLWLLKQIKWGGETLLGSRLVETGSTGSTGWDGKKPR
jgi:hypothetical protein